MKKLFLLLALLGMVVTGCSKDEGGNIPDDAYISLDKEIVTISPDGESVGVKVYSNYAWELTNNCDWITTSITSGDASDTGVTVTLTADLTYDDRDGTIIFSCGKAKKLLVVSQKFKKAIIPDANNTFDIPAEGGVAIISYQTSVDCDVIIPEEAQDWITIAPASRGLVSESITLDIAENTTYSARTAVVKVVAKDNTELAVEYTITQEQNNAVLANGNTEFIIDGKEQQITIKHKANVDCEVIIPNEAQDWITIAPVTRGLVSESITLNIAENTPYSARTAVIKVVAKDNVELAIEYTIKQEQNDVILVDDNNTFAVPSAGGEVAINYQTNIDCEVIIPKYAQSWITIAPATRGLSTYSTTLNIAENTTYSSRTAVIKVVAKDNAELAVEYTINQEQKNGVLVDGNNTFTVPGIGGSVLINYQANVDCEVIIPDEAQDWVTIAPATRGLVTYNTTLNIAENNSGKERSCVVKVISQDDNELSAEYTIIQNPRYYLYYTSNDGKIVQPNSSAFGATIISNTYIDGVGVIEFDAPITTIGGLAFYGRCFLTSVTIPDSVTTIGDAAFYNCISLTSVTIPDSVTTIGERAFCYCSSLTSVTIPDSVTTIGDDAFYDCSSLTSVYISDLSAWCKIDFGGSSVNPLLRNGVNLYLNNELVTDLVIPSDITEIKSYAFFNCRSLTSITIPDSVIKIGDDAFGRCESLTSVTIPDSVTTIGSSAFRDCSSLTSVTIGDSVTTIGDWAFAGCTSELIIHSKIIENNYTSKPSWLSGAEFTKLTIGDSVTTIGRSAFYDCSSLTSVTIPDSVTTIGSSAFAHCSSLTSVTIGDSVTMIRGGAFYDCNNLTSVTIGDSVTTIGYNAFQYCSSLTSVTIPDSVTTIGEAAFNWCERLTSVYCKPTTPPAGGNGMFYNNASGRKIYVPMESIEAYKSASGWSEYADDIVGYNF